jgi:hypothetical protein
MRNGGDARGGEREMRRGRAYLREAAVVVDEERGARRGSAPRGRRHRREKKVDGGGSPATGCGGSVVWSGAQIAR